MYSILNTNVRKSVQEVVNIILVSLQAGTKAGTQASFYVSFSLNVQSRWSHRASFTPTVNVIVFMSGTFDLFLNGHFDGKNRCATYFAYHNSAIHKAAGLTVLGCSMIWLVLFHHSTFHPWSRQWENGSHSQPMGHFSVEWWNSGIVPVKLWNGWEPWGRQLCE